MLGRLDAGLAVSTVFARDTIEASRSSAQWDGSRRRKETRSVEYHAEEGVRVKGGATVVTHPFREPARRQLGIQVGAHSSPTKESVTYEQETARSHRSYGTATFFGRWGDQAADQVDGAGDIARTELQLKLESR